MTATFELWNKFGEACCETTRTTFGCSNAVEAISSAPIKSANSGLFQFDQDGQPQTVLYHVLPICCSMNSIWRTTALAIVSHRNFSQATRNGAAANRGGHFSFVKTLS